MRTLVVYESMYGNTEHVARAIAEGLGDAEVFEVGAAPTRLPEDLELLVVGGPTHGHGMTRDASRHNAAARVDRPVRSQRIGIREWIEEVQPARAIAATFDTRIKGPKILTGSAASAASGKLRDRGFRLAPSESFVLEGVTGEPFDRMSDTELERARQWGRSLSGLLAGSIA
jgi:hypothetical protein